MDLWGSLHHIDGLIPEHQALSRVLLVGVPGFDSEFFKRLVVGFVRVSFG